MDFFQILLSPFVWILTVFYNLFDNYGIALILFAVVVKLILFPFSLKGKKSMIQMNMLNGKMQKLQKQYGKDRERYNQELQKLYEREKVNPMSGCLWSLIPLFILLPLYAIIRQPLTYMMGVNTQEQFNAIAAAVDWNSIAVQMGWIKEAADGFANTGYNQLFLASLINENTVGAVQEAIKGLSVQADQIFPINFMFLGVDLSQIPNVKFWVSGGFGLFLIPIISAATGFIMSLITMKTNAVNNQAAQAANNSTNKTMLLMSPIMSLWIGFVMPAGLGIYWIAQNVLAMLQEFISGKLLKKDYERAAEQRAIQEQQEREEEKRKRKEVIDERMRRIEEAKQNKGKKKAPKKPKDEDEDKIPGAVKEASRVGMRQYARGRAYDPNRYGIPPTPYHEPGQPVDEVEIEQALEEKATTPVDMPVDEVVESPVEETAAGQMVEAPNQGVDAPMGGSLEDGVQGDEAEAPYAQESEADEEKEEQ